MRERRELGDQGRLDELRARNLDRPLRVDERRLRHEPGGERGLHEVLALADEQPRALALMLRDEPPHEPHPCHEIHSPWKSRWPTWRREPGQT